MNGETQEKAIGESPIAPYSVVPSITPFGEKRVSKVYTNDMKVYVILNLNRRIPNGTYGGVRGRGLITPSYSILKKMLRKALHNRLIFFKISLMILKGVKR
jgi:hypothetical protein